MREELENIVPESSSKPYDMHEVIKGIIDEDSFFEIHKNYADNIIVGFARLGGQKHWNCSQSTYESGRGA